MRKPEHSKSKSIKGIPASAPCVSLWAISLFALGLRGTAALRFRWFTAHSSTPSHLALHLGRQPYATTSWGPLCTTAKFPADRPLMGWSGRAPAPPANEAGEGAPRTKEQIDDIAKSRFTRRGLREDETTMEDRSSQHVRTLVTLTARSRSIR